MDYFQVQPDIETKCELKNSNKNLISESVVSCLDDNLNYTYALSCKGGIY